MCLIEDQGAVEEFAAAGADPAFHDCVHARDAVSGRDDGDAVVGEDRIERGDELVVAVADQVPHARAGVLKIHDEVSGHLGRPGCWGMCGRAENPNAAGGMLDNGQDVQSGAGEGRDLEEVRGEDGGCLAAQEGGPGLSVALGLGSMP
ncbi:MAG: hypothetical protein ACRDRV_03535 [Pseudonocardiaceae bacterium]